MYGKIISEACTPKIGEQVINITTLEDKDNTISYMIGIVEDIEDCTSKVKVLNTNDKVILMHNQQYVYIDHINLKTLMVRMIEMDGDKVIETLTPLKHSQWYVAVLKGEVDGDKDVKFELKTVSDTTFAKIIPGKKIVFDIEDVEAAFNAGRDKAKKGLFSRTEWKHNDFNEYKQKLQTE